MESKLPAGGRVAAPRSSGIKVIIVGLGLGGLAAVIECQRKGHQVIAIDQQQVLKPIGDSIAVPNNAAKVIRQWDNGSVDRRLQPMLNNAPSMDIYNTKGELLTRSEMVGYGRGYGYPCHRGELVMVFYDYAKTLPGVEFRLGHRVTEYWETEDQAGVVIDGQRLGADIVIGADGVHSKARGHATSDDATPHSSGYAIYRSWFDADEVAADPKSRWILPTEPETDNCHVYIADDIHCMIASGKSGKEVFWMDEYDVTESWSEPGNLKDALKYIKDWPVYPKLEAVMRKTPKTNLIDFKLLWRDPLSSWVSKGGRMMVIGDAAHPILPTSGQGAGQAIEDAATVAVTLQLAGKSAARDALKVTQVLRYKRASMMQYLGIETRDVWHKTDWEAVKKNPKLLVMPRPEWIFGHDCQKYAYDEYEKAVEYVRNGGSYEPSNVPTAGVDHRTTDFWSDQFTPSTQVAA